MSPVWNSLEVAKLVLSSLTPLAIGLLGIYIHRTTKRFENRQWISQKLIEKRLHIYDDIAPLLNDLLCYFTYVGCWKELDPPALVKLKRDLDKKIYLAAPLFPPAFATACIAFEGACFSTYGAWGADATLRTATDRRQSSHHVPWQPEWSKHFTRDTSDPEEVRRLYAQVMREFSSSFEELDFTSSASRSLLPKNLED